MTVLSANASLSESLWIEHDPILTQFCTDPILRPYQISKKEFTDKGAMIFKDPDMDMDMDDMDCTIM